MAPTSPAAVRRTLLRDLAADVARTAGVHLSAADVHGRRKRIKRARAALELLRPALCQTDYDACKRSLRDAGRSLATARDATVMAQTYLRMRELTRGLPPQASRQPPAWLTEDGPPGDPADAKVAHRHLRAALLRLERARLEGRGWAPLGSGVRGVYRRGRRRRPEQSHPSTEALHAWRRHVKHYWHVLELFEHVHPQRLSRPIADAHRLSDLLGEVHDLAVLAGRLRGRRGRIDRAVLATVAERHARLTHRALLLGAKVYDDPARVVERRLRHDWERWRRP
jgi:CHAD domain-containing protein